MDDEIEGQGSPSYGVSVAAGLVGIVFLDTVALLLPWAVAIPMSAVVSSDTAALAVAAAILWTGVFGFAQFGWAVPIAAIAHWRGNQGLAVGVLVGSALVSLVLVGCLGSLVLGIGAMCGNLMMG